MKITYFIQELNAKSLNKIQYNVYIFDPEKDTEIDLRKQKDQVLEIQVRNLVTHAIKTIGDILKTKHKNGEESELKIELHDMLEIILAVQAQFLLMIDDKEVKCEDSHEQAAIRKVRMIVDDVFKKIPQLAGEIYHPVV